MLEELHTQTNEETAPKIEYVWEEGTPKDVNEYVSYPYHAYFEKIELEEPTPNLGNASVESS